MYQSPIGAPPICVEVVVTGRSVDWLANLTRMLMGDGLIAYGCTIAPIHAMYRRGGKIHDEEQLRLVLHTRASLVSEIIDRASRDRDESDVPSVVAMQLVEVDPDYLQWIMHETAAGVEAVSARGKRRSGGGGHGRWSSRFSH